MRGSLGEKIGEGAAAEVHAWAPGQVVKLFKPGASRRLSWHEAHMTDAVFAAGAPAPEVFGVVILEGRFGLVLQRFDGPTLLQLTRSGAVTRGQAGAILADLCLAVRNTPPPPAVISLRNWVDAWVRSASGTLPAAHRHRRPRPRRASAAGRRALPWRPSPRQRDHDGGGAEAHRLERSGPRARRLGSCGSATSS